MTKEQRDFLDALAEEQQDRMISLTFRRVGDTELANDIVQEVLLTACWKIDEVCRHENPVGWLFETLNYMTKREMRKAYHAAEVPLAADVPIRHDVIELPMENYLPNGLTEREQALLLLRIKEDRTYDEIAEMRGISPAACRKQMSRAVEKCRRLMSEDPAGNVSR